MTILERAPTAAPPEAARRAEPGQRRAGGGWSAERRQALAGYLFVSPAMIIFFIFTLLPVVYAFYLSFTNYDVFTRQDWIGAANYTDIFEDDIFITALKNTATYTVFSIPLSMAF